MADAEKRYVESEMTLHLGTDSVDLQSLKEKHRSGFRSVLEMMKKFMLVKITRKSNCSGTYSMAIQVYCDDAGLIRGTHQQSSSFTDESSTRLPQKPLD